MTDTATTSSSSSSETFAFSADINQLLSLIINTFYSNKDVFLRELLSNSSDALDKLRYEALTDPSQLSEHPELGIRIVANTDDNTLSICDSGIGMTKQDLVNNLGTIAKSGTKGFMEALQAGTELSMIGQFGVGFYSAYLVADRVKVTSKHNSESDAHVWESAAGGSFTIRQATSADLSVPLPRGTIITLQMKEDMLDYLSESTLRNLVRTHSQYTDFPIHLQVSKTVDKEVTDSDEESETEETKEETKEEGEEKAEENADEEADDDDAPVVEDVADEKEAAPKERKTKTVSEVTTEWDLLNENKPLWVRDSKDVEPTEYTAFYKSLTNDWDEPLAVQHFSVEGQLEFKACLFIPKRPPTDMFNGGGSSGKRAPNNVKLYVRRVFISDQCDDLMPEWLSFVRGVVDSEDLPLNISREMLQQNKILRVIKKNLVKKTLDLLNTLAEDDPEKYAIFYKTFSKNLKLGIHEDTANRPKLANLLRYSSTQHENVSLSDYVSRMADGQKNIFYVTGESLSIVQKCPFIERLRSKDIEVLYMVDPIDEYAMQQLKDFEGKTMVCVTKEGLQFDDSEDDAAAFEKAKTDFEGLCTHVKEVLDNSVTKVVISQRLQTSPCVLVTGEYGWSANMERIMRAQALRDSEQSTTMNSQKTLELNPTHAIVVALKERYEVDKSCRTVKDLVWLLYDTSLLTSGFSLDSPVDFGDRIHRLIKLGLNLDDDDDEDEEDDTLPTVDDSAAKDEGKEDDNEEEEEESQMEEVD
jgi:molecular chaperone HtpG